MDTQTDSIKIISYPDEKNPFTVIYKPKGIPSAPLSETGTDSALSLVSEMFPEIKNVAGKKQIEHGLIHRIDTLTDGLLLVATTQESYDFFIEQQQKNAFIKRYKAVCEFAGNIGIQKQGFPKCGMYKRIKNMEDGETLHFIQQSRFRAFGTNGREVRPVTDGSGKAAEKKAGEKLYSTKIQLEKKDGGYFARCEIASGFRHQVRCHLAWSGIPVKGDPLYNPAFRSGQQFLFTACELEFLHPLTKKRLTFSL